MMRYAAVSASLCTFIALAVAAPAFAQNNIKYLEGHSDPIYAVAYSPDGRLTATGSFDRTAKIWYRTPGKPIRTITDHQNILLCIAFSRDGQQLATGSLDNTVKLYDVPVPTPVASLDGQPAEVMALATSADGKFLVTGDKSKL